MLPGESVDTNLIQAKCNGAPTEGRELRLYRFDDDNDEAVAEEEESTTTLNDDGSRHIVDSSRSKQSVFRRSRLLLHPCQPSSLSRPHFPTNFAYRPEGGSCGGGGGSSSRLLLLLVAVVVVEITIYNTLLKELRRLAGAVVILNNIDLNWGLLSLTLAFQRSKNYSIWGELLTVQPMI